jgi:uncharacterized protein (TIGR03437 family)
VNFVKVRRPGAISSVWKLALPLVAALSIRAQAPNITSVVNAFSAVPIVPLGSLAAVNGSDFGIDRTSLTVTVGGQAAFVVSATDTRLIVQMPWSGGSMIVTRAGAASAAFNVLLAQYAVGIETTNGRNALLLDAASLNQVSQVQRGETVIAFATGMGPTNPPLPLGVLPTGTTTCASPPKVSIGPFDAPVSSCQLDPNSVGVYQLKFTIPQTAISGPQSLVISFSFTRPGTAENQPVTVTVALATPAVNAIVENAASNLPPGLPNSGVAQGAMFVVKGSGLGPPDVVQASGFPLPKSLGGTSVAVTVGGTTASAIMFYAQASQVAAILPSATPLGEGTVTVQYNGQSISAPITVVQNRIGIFTVNESGSGDAIAFVNTDGGLVTPSHAANPGEVVVFWGTGLGPVDFDETNAAVDADMPQVPLQVLIGGREAEVVFRGRNSCCSSIDTVYVRIPEGVSGCAVSMNMQIGGSTSAAITNSTTIAVASSGRRCARVSPDPTMSGTGTRAFAGFGLNRLVNTFPANAPKTDSASSAFQRVTFASTPPPGSQMDINSYDSCTTTVTLARTQNPPSPNAVQYLDAGRSIGFSGSFGDATLTSTTSAAGTSYQTILDTTGKSLTPGQYTFSANGGADVGAFTAAYSMLAPFLWTNAFYNHDTVNRAAGVTVQWAGGDPEGYVVVGGNSLLLGSTTTTSGTVAFACTARVSDGSFTVPPYVLLSLPTGSGALTVYSVAKPQPLAPPPGIDEASATTTVFYSSAVVFN